jgi:hypothetical protein
MVLGAEAERQRGGDPVFHGRLADRVIYLNRKTETEGSHTS